MSKLTTITDRALELASQAGTSLKHAVPGADKLLQTGAALGVAKTGGKLAVNFVRRNPAVAVATGIGVGLLALSPTASANRTRPTARSKASRVAWKHARSMARPRPPPHARPARKFP